MISWRMFALSLAAVLLAVPAVRAQDVGAARIATCNPGKVFEGMDEKKTLEQKMKSEREKIQVDIERRKAEVKELQNQLQGLKPDSLQYKAKSKEIMEKAIDYEVWVRLTDGEIKRQEKDQLVGLYDKIKEGSAAVAAAKKIDLVLVERKPEIKTDDPNLTPDQVRAILSQNDVLFSAPKVDITADVIVEVNKKFAGGATPAPAPK